MKYIIIHVGLRYRRYRINLSWSDAMETLRLPIVTESFDGTILRDKILDRFYTKGGHGLLEWELDEYRRDIFKEARDVFTSTERVHPSVISLSRSNRFYLFSRCHNHLDTDLNALFAGAVLPSDQSMLIDDIHEKSSNGKAANSSLPDLFYDSNGFKVWYLHDVNRFPVPKAEIFLRILSSSHIDFKGIEFKQEDEIANGDKSHRDRSLALILHDLSIAVVKDILNEKLYVASIAELYCDIESSQNIGMSIKVSGFGDKAHVLALEVTQTYFNLVNYINPSRPGKYHSLKIHILEYGIICFYLSYYVDGYNEASFLRELEDLCKKYENADMKASHAANNARMALLQPDFPSYYQRYHYLKRYRPYVTLWLLQEYMQTVMKGIYIEMLCQGNLSKVIVNNMIHNILSMEISRETLDEGSKSKRLVRDLCDDNNKPRLSVIQISSDPSISDVMGNARDDIAGTGSILLRVEPQSRNEKNICVQLYYQISLENILIITMLELYDQIISEPLFDDLRTKQQVRLRLTRQSMSCLITDITGVIIIYLLYSWDMMYRVK